MNKIIAAIVTAICGLMLTVTPVLASTTTTIPKDIEATVTVIAVCDLTVNTDPINFGTLLQGGASGAVGRSLTLDANTPTDVRIFGTTWTGSDPAHTFSVGQTTYGLDGSPDTPLKLSTGDLLFPSEVDASHTVNFELAVPNPQAADTYGQTITLSFSCNQGPA